MIFHTIFSRTGYLPHSLLSIILVTWMVGCWSARATAAEVTVCVDPESPPYVYWARDAHQNKTNELTGSTIELIRNAFLNVGVDVKFVSLPWVRCLRSVELGAVNFAAGAYYDEERAKIFTYSQAYNQFTPQVFYLAKKSLKIHLKEDLKKYRGCGLIGFSYAHYGLKPEDLDLGVTSYQSLFDKLKAGRCDYFVEELETIVGERLIGQDYLADNAFAHGPIVDAVAPKEYMVTAKTAESARLMPAVNGQFAILIASGQAAKLLDKHTNILRANLPH